MQVVQYYQEKNLLSRLGGRKSAILKLPRFVVMNGLEHWRVGELE